MLNRSIRLLLLPHVEPNFLNIFEQDRSLTYGADNLDSKWFASVFGDDVLNAITGKRNKQAGAY
jgi:hypothetical protein